MAYFNIGDIVTKNADDYIGKIVEINEAGRLRIFWSHRINKSGELVEMNDKKRTWMQPVAVHHTTIQAAKDAARAL